MMQISIRKAVFKDLKEITAIYNEAVLTSEATFDLIPKTVEERVPWFYLHQGKYLLLIAQSNNEVIGYSSLSPYLNKDACIATAELSIYVKKEWRRQNVASLLLKKMLDLSQKQGLIHNIVSLITAGNTASKALHQKFGFSFAGHMPNIAKKFGKSLGIDYYYLINPSNKEEKMTELLDLIKERRSIRKFKADPVPKQLILKIMEAGSYAASGRNSQSATIIAITSKDLREKISKLNAQILGKSDFDTFYGAPLILMVIAKASASTAVYDGTLALGNMMLEAHALGLGSCWIHRCKEEMQTPLAQEIIKLAGLQGDDFIGVGHLAVGYPDGALPKAAPRREHSCILID